MKPLVSVIIPLYQSALTISETLGSLQAQSLQGWEAIVVDDGSTDPGPSVVSQHAAADHRIRMIHQSNRGLAGARNSGLDHATGQFVYFLDADDWTTPRGLDSLVRAALAHGGAAHGAYECRGSSGQSLGVTCRPSAHSVGLDELLTHNRFASHAHIVERRSLSRLRFDESLRVVEDYDLWLRLAEQGVRWHAIDDVVAGYRVRPASLSKDFAAMNETAALVVHAAYQRARTSGLAAIDAGPERLQRTVRSLAIEYWTMAAISASVPDEDLVRRFFGTNARGTPIEPEAAAVAAYWAIVLARGQRPEAKDSSAPEWLFRLATAWHSLESSAMVAPGFREAATEALANALVSPERVAAAILERCVGRRTVVIGYGRNGRAIGSVAEHLGHGVAVRDDDANVTRRIEEEAPANVTTEPMNAPIGTHDAVVLSPSESTALAARFAPRRTVRWSCVRDELAQAERAEIVRGTQTLPSTARAASLQQRSRAVRGSAEITHAPRE